MTSLYFEAIILIALLTMSILIFALVISELPYFISVWKADRKIRKHNKEVEERHLVEK